MSERRDQTWVLYGLIAANVVMFAIEIAAGADPLAPSAQQLIELGGSYPPLTLHGEWWRLGTSMFLHYGVIHLGMNMLCLYQAREAEPAFGRLGFLTLYILAGLGGGLAALMVGAPNGVSAGASGCVFGVYGALVAQLIQHRDELEDAVQDAVQAKKTRRLISFLVLNTLIGLGVPGISFSAHVGGFIVGVALGVALLVKPGAELTRTPRALALAALGLALTAGGLLIIKPPTDVTPVLQHFDAVEHSMSTTMTAINARSQAGELKEAALADAIEREVIAPYRGVQQELRATTRVPDRLRPLFARIDELMVARLAWMQSYQAVVRESDPAKRAALQAEYERATAAQAKAVEAVAAETARLNELTGRHPE